MALAGVVMASGPPLKVYGNESTFRTELGKRIRIAGELRARLDSTVDRYRLMPPPDPGLKGLARRLATVPTLSQFNAIDESASTWARNNTALFERYLGPGAQRFAEQQGHLRGAARVEVDGESRAVTTRAFIDHEVGRLQQVLVRLPQPGAVSIREINDRFTELRQTNLVEQSVLNAYMSRMSKVRTRPQISAAIGAAKELVEACNRATLDRLEVPYPTDDFGKLGKLVRREVLRREGPSPTALAAVDQLFAGMATVEMALATLRNDVGEGHGRPTLPDGLRPRHAQLAIDIAETHVRYLVATLTDLKLI
jgi:hypothetical protein